MCCFSIARPAGLLASLWRPRVRVSKTNLFARRASPGRQLLAYGMDLQTDVEVAMILPLPVPVGAGEEAVRFVDLSRTPQMFAELALLFDAAEPQPRKGGLSVSLPSRQRLIVHKVGAFVASYVPTRRDFSRLDPRFRLPEVLFDAVPAYADHGFAVFQLAPGEAGSPVTIHPMGLDLPTRDSARLFFPTVHVHDGRFHSTAAFDHALYYQSGRIPAGLSTWDGDEIGWDRPTHTYAGLVEPSRPIARRVLRGRLPNADTWIPAD